MGAGDDAAGRAREPLVRFVTLRWVPLTASLVSLVLSAAAIVAATQQPQVMLIMPDQVRIAQGRSAGAAYVYLQPAFVNTGQNDRVEVIRDMRLRVAGGGVAPTDFNWTEQVRPGRRRCLRGPELRARGRRRASARQRT